MKLLRFCLPILLLIFANGTASAQAPANDNFADRSDLGTTLPVDVSQSLENATIEDGEQNAFSPELGTVWWEWEAPKKGTFLFTANIPLGSRSEFS